MHKGKLGKALSGPKIFSIVSYSMKSFLFAQSRGGLSILGYYLGAQGPRVLLLGGVHGDEVEGVALAQELMAKYHRIFPYKLQLMLIPLFNMDGILAQTRCNCAGVDLNRNLPTQDWTVKERAPRYHPGRFANSEPENQALTTVIDKFRPQLIISFHSFSRWMINVNGDCSREADLLHDITRYPIHEDIGYPTPGSLGTYAGQERNIPTITYELRRGQALHTLLPLHVKAVDECLQLVQYTR